ncbi:MAG: undecaprenyl diphosphate synthase family protein, partial [Actinomycetota bacterium]
RLDALVDIARRAQAQFVTVHPHELADTSPSVGFDIDRLRRRIDRDEVCIVIDPVVDGRDRILGVVSNWGGRRGLTEERLSRALFGEAGEPDLVVILGPAHRLPRSLVWELAYGELVFLPVTWADLAVEHMRTAIDDFARRQRRFGGVD